MTCVVAIEHKGNLYFGGDSFCADLEDEIVDLCDTPKVYKCGEVLIGICGSVKCEGVLEKCAKTHILKRKNVTKDWIKNNFLEILQKEMIKSKAIESKNDSIQMPDTTFLIGVQGEILILQDDFSFYRSARKFAAIGLGAPYALGALNALESFNISPEEKIKLALKTSSEFSYYVREPFHIIANKQKVK